MRSLQQVREANLAISHSRPASCLLAPISSSLILFSPSCKNPQALSSPAAENEHALQTSSFFPFKS